MHGKRGQQLSVAILGIVIFLGLVGILYQVDKTVKELRSQQERIDDSSFAARIQSCLEDSLEDAAMIITPQGGYVDLPQRRVSFGGGAVPIVLSSTGFFQYPSREEVADAIAQEAERLLPGCVDLIVVDYEIQRELPQVKISLNEDTIGAELEYPMTLRIGRNEQAVSSWTAVVPSVLPQLFSVTKGYVEAQKEKSVIRLGPLLDAAAGNGFVVTLTDLGNNIVGYKWQADQLTWQFVIEYAWDGMDESFGGIVSLTPQQVNALKSAVRIEQGTMRFSDFEGIIFTKKTNSPPVVPVYATQKVIVGRTLLFPLNVYDPDGDKLTYEILTPLPGLEITSAGYLKWGPTEYQETTIRFAVSDGKETREGKITFIVESRPHNLLNRGWYDNY